MRLGPPFKHIRDLTGKTDTGDNGLKKGMLIAVDLVLPTKCRSNQCKELFEFYTRATERFDYRDSGEEDPERTITIVAEVLNFNFSPIASSQDKVLLQILSSEAR
jgi:hypothetical protein